MQVPSPYYRQLLPNPGQQPVGAERECTTPFQPHRADHSSTIRLNWGKSTYIRVRCATHMLRAKPLNPGRPEHGFASLMAEGLGKAGNTGHPACFCFFLPGLKAPGNSWPPWRTPPHTRRPAHPRTPPPPAFPPGRTVGSAGVRSLAAPRAPGAMAPPAELAKLLRTGSDGELSRALRAGSAWLSRVEVISNEVWTNLCTRTEQVGTPRRCCDRGSGSKLWYLMVHVHACAGHSPVHHMWRGSCANKAVAVVVERRCGVRTRPRITFKARRGLTCWLDRTNPDRE